jgi:hypothetical protein
MARHYDPRYVKQRSLTGAAQPVEVATDSLSPEVLPGLATRIVAELDRLG